MDVVDWQRRAQTVMDSSRMPPMSLNGRGPLVGKIALFLLAVLFCTPPTIR